MASAALRRADRQTSDSAGDALQATLPFDLVDGSVAADAPAGVVWARDLDARLAPVFVGVLAGRSKFAVEFHGGTVATVYSSPEDDDGQVVAADEHTLPTRSNARSVPDAEWFARGVAAIESMLDARDQKGRKVSVRPLARSAQTYRHWAVSWVEGRVVRALGRVAASLPYMSELRGVTAYHLAHGASSGYWKSAPPVTRRLLDVVVRELGASGTELRSVTLPMPETSHHAMHARAALRRYATFRLGETDAREMTTPPAIGDTWLGATRIDASIRGFADCVRDLAWSCPALFRGAPSRELALNTARIECSELLKGQELPDEFASVLTDLAMTFGPTGHTMVAGTACPRLADAAVGYTVAVDAPSEAQSRAACVRSVALFVKNGGWLSSHVRTLERLTGL